MSLYDEIRDIVAAIQKKRPNFIPRMGLILGSGLGAIAKKITNATIIPYRELPNFHICTVDGHEGNLYLGELNGLPVACFQGRAHLYEGISPNVVKKFIYTLKLLGCEFMFTTNAVGSLRLEYPPASLVLLKDHINLQFLNPLFGPNEKDFGPRFPSMDDAYDAKLRKIMQDVATKLQIKLPEGVYFGACGPSFETHAEIRAFQMLGGDVVGMSTIAEVILARHCGLRVIGMSVVVNYGAGLQSEHITHDLTLKNSAIAAGNLTKLIEEFCHELSK
jgi:xanthosine phosphorylase